MGLAEAAVSAIHILFAALWTGSVLFVTYSILPLARDGNLNAAPLASLTGKLQTISRTSVVLLLLTGGHIAAQRYTAETLIESGRGHLVVTMVVLWLVLAALVEVGANRLTAGTNAEKVRSPARKAMRIFQAASLVAVLLLLDAGALAGNLIS